MKTFERSRQLYERACETCPGGIHSNVRANWSPHPMFYERGEGSHVWDVDGNEFIDYVLARGPLLLGHSPEPVLEAVVRQMEKGLMYAGQHALEIDASEQFCRMVPCAEMVRFASSGSEAVQGAMRLARGVTGRTKIVRFEGHYHGWIDNQFWNFAPPLESAGPREAPVPTPVSKGQPLSDADNLVIRPWNDLDLMKQVFKAHPGEIAAVLCEPIMCNMGCIFPQPGYLEGLRALCTQHGSLLIFDEVITGFRVSPGGAQERLGVLPDVATFAKGMAAGFPVSAIAGRREWLKAFGDFSVTHSGTYNSSVPCMAATLAALRMLAADRSALLRHARDMGEQLAEGIREAARQAGRTVRISGFGTAFHVSFGPDEGVIDYRTFVLHRDVDATRRFWLALQDRGIRVTPDGLWFVSTAHTRDDVDQTLAAVRDVMKEM